MLKPAQFRILMGAGGLALVLSVTNMFMVQANTQLKGEANGRAQFIQQSIALEQLYSQLVQELAQRAVRTQDGPLHDLLAAEGINVSMAGAPAGAEKPR